MNTQQLATHLTHTLTEPGSLPVPLKALIAAAVMASRGAPLTRLGMAKTGGYSYGSSQTHYPGLLDALIERIPTEIAEATHDQADPALATRLRADIQQRDATITALRAERAALRDRLEELRKYALALHQRISELDKQEAAHGGSPVRHLQPID